MRWSHSRLTTFENCKYEFYLKYLVNNEQLYPQENNYYAELGSFVHKILAMVFEGKLTPEEAAEYYVNNYESNIDYRTRKATMEKSFETCAEYFASTDFDWLKNYTVIAVEQKLEFKVQDYDFIAYIDLLVKDIKDGKMVVIDHKSSEYPFKKNRKVRAKCKETFEKYKSQMYLYCHAIKDKYGEFPKEIVWNHFKDGGKLTIIPFNEGEYQKVIQQLVSTIHKIENEEDYEPRETCFYCKELCNFRHSCEYVGGEETV